MPPVLSRCIADVRKATAINADLSKAPDVSADVRKTPAKLVKAWCMYDDAVLVNVEKLYIWSEFRPIYGRKVQDLVKRFLVCPWISHFTADTAFMISQTVGIIPTEALIVIHEAHSKDGETIKVLEGNHRVCMYVYIEHGRHVASITNRRLPC